MFPDFNIHSTSLLILALQGFVFAVLLLWRYLKVRHISDLILGLILLITVWHQTSYTVGFMAWYDTFRNTKINYFLIDLSFLLAPLIYFYVKSLTVPHFKFTRKSIYHFIPGLLYVLYKLIIYLYDFVQPGFSETQNGYLMTNLELNFGLLIASLLMKMQMVVYFALTIVGFMQYRKKLRHIFSNTFSLELNWIRNFLAVYFCLFIYLFWQDVIDFAVIDL